MQRKLFVLLGLVVLVALTVACVPQTYTRPVQIQEIPADQIKQAKIAMDAAGRSHIAGVKDDRIYYYRTRYGEMETAFSMTMTSTGALWKQYDPDIAVTDNGTAYLVWVEQRGGTEKYACWRSVPLLPPVGGYNRTCNLLDSPYRTTGNVRVVGRGSVIYAVYDRINDSGEIDRLYYEVLTGAVKGIIVNYSGSLEAGYIFGLDLAIDSSGYLHVAYIDTDGYHAFQQRLWYRSNASVTVDSTMNQVWLIIDMTANLQTIDPSISFYNNGAVETVAVASVYEQSSLDDIWVDACTAVGCGGKTSTLVSLPPSWNTVSVIKDVNLAGVDDILYLSFIGDDDTAPTGVEQIWYKNALNTDVPVDISNGSATFKYDLQMVKLNAPPNTLGVAGFPMMVWAESNLSSIQFYVFDGFTFKSKIQDTTCLSSLPAGDLATHGYYLAGVWDACSDTWFSARANMTNLPMVVK